MPLHLNIPIHSLYGCCNTVMAGCTEKGIWVDIDMVDHSMTFLLLLPPPMHSSRQTSCFIVVNLRQSSPPNQRHLPSAPIAPERCQVRHEHLHSRCTWETQRICIYLDLSAWRFSEQELHGRWLPADQLVDYMHTKFQIADAIKFSLSTTKRVVNKVLPLTGTFANLKFKMDCSCKSFNMHTKIGLGRTSSGSQPRLDWFHHNHRNLMLQYGSKTASWNGWFSVPECIHCPLTRQQNQNQGDRGCWWTKLILFKVAAVLLVEHRQQQAHPHLLPGGNLVMPAKSLLPLQ